MISIENVKMDDSNRRIHGEFTKRTKSRARGFGFTIPSLLYEPFKSYINELRPKVTGENFLKNWKASKKHPEGGARYQNMGKDQLTKMLDNICVFLSKPRDQVTGHVWRRSAATCLANSGMSLINLKRAGRWKSVTSCEKYLEHCLSIKLDRMNRLEGLIAGGEVLITNVSKTTVKIENFNYLQIFLAEP